MAKLTPTGEFEAITLEHLHSAEILYLERKVGQAKAENGGFGKIFIELKRGLVHLAECTTSQIFNRGRKGPCDN
jgi:hypothetical protein